MMISALWHRISRGVSRVREQSDWSKYMPSDWPQRIMTESVTDRFHAKQGRSIGRWTLNGGSRNLVVYLKRHYQLPRWLGWMATLFPQRAWSPGLAEWEHLDWARRAGVPAPRPVAAGEWIGPWGRLQSFLAVEELAGMLPLHEAIPLAHQVLGSTEFAAWKRGLIREMARIVCDLHRRGRYHRDLYLCHFYVSESDIHTAPRIWLGRVFLIDFHRLGIAVVAGRYQRIKDLAQLLYSTDITGVTDRDRARFAREYGLEPNSRWLRWAIRFKANRYARHHRRHG